MSYQILEGDVIEVLRTMESCSVQCVVTSPPYWSLRDYSLKPSIWGGKKRCAHEWNNYEYRLEDHGDDGTSKFTAEGSTDAQQQTRLGTISSALCARCGAWLGCLGLEPTLNLYLKHIVAVFRAVWRVLRDDGTLWMNLGDSYCADTGPVRGPTTLPGARVPSGWTNRAQPRRVVVTRRGNERDPKRGEAAKSGVLHGIAPQRGLKPKDLCMLPARVAIALQADGWYLRSDIIWCLSGGATVYARTQKGDMPMRIKDMVRLEPSTVKLWNGQKWTQVLGWSQSPEPRDGALEIELRNGERIGCTAGHQWPTQRGNVQTDALVVGDVISTTKLPEPDTPTHASALDSDVAWLCGLYLAEGSMSGNTVQLAGNAQESEYRIGRLESIAQRFHGTIRVHTDRKTASICMDGPVVAAIVRAYIYGDNAATKGLKTRVWQRANDFLLALFEGYLDGDGHDDISNGRWRLSFTRNDRLASDLRTLAARLGLSMRLGACTVRAFGRDWPAYRGDVRLDPTMHRNARKDGEIVAIRRGRGRKFWDIGVEDDPHLFALASGVLTHNSKPNPMPESVADRPTKAHEYLFLLAKSPRYYYDAKEIRELASDDTHARYARGRSDNHKWADGGPGNQTIATNRPGSVFGKTPQDQAEVNPKCAEPGSGIKQNSSFSAAVKDIVEFRNKRSVWTISTQPYSGAHFATFPEDLVRPCILAGCPQGGTVLDPFCGSGTTLLVARHLGCKSVGIELNPEYIRLAEKRLSQEVLEFPSATECRGTSPVPVSTEAPSPGCSTSETLFMEG